MFTKGGVSSGYGQAVRQDDYDLHRQARLFVMVMAIILIAVLIYAN